MKTEPITLIIERIDILLEEPENLKTYQNLVAKLLEDSQKTRSKSSKKKKENNPKSNDRNSSNNSSDASPSQPMKSKDSSSVKYGTAEKIVDGISIEIGRQLFLSILFHLNNNNNHNQ